MDISTQFDTLWVLFATALVFLMQCGFLCLEAGLTRTKNSINVAVKNLVDFAVAVLLFWAVGFGIMFGNSHQGWFGTTMFGYDVGQGSASLAAFFLFQAAFCGAAVTIMSGAVAERTRFGGYMLMVIVVGAFVYPLFGHWAWGGVLGGEPGWLSKMGFVDFAGSTVVHSVGGWAAAAACLVIGSRIDRFDEDGKPRQTVGSNLPMAMLGALLLWIGWIGFNGGSTLAFNIEVPGIIANTMIAGAAGLAMTTLVGWGLYGYANPAMPINGCLAGLVAITAGAHAVTGSEAAIIGAFGGLIAYSVYERLLFFKIDDVVSAVPVHLAAGIWGTLAVAVFGDPIILGTGLTVLQQLGVQALGVVVCGGLTFGVTFVVLTIAHKTVGIRVSEEAEKQGLNFSEHRASTELAGLASTIENQVKTNDLSLRAPVEPFTEVGQIAEAYNGLMELIQQTTTDVEDLRATEKLLRDAIDEAQDANRAKSEFLANMSHEIRTPLHGILSFAEFGKSKVGQADEAKIRQYFEKINVSGDRLLNLVNDLLDLSKLEAGRMRFEMEEIELAMVVGGVVDEMGSLLANRGAKVVLHRPQGKVRAEVDSLKLMQVVRNLIHNAVKFSADDQPIDVTIERHGEIARVSIRDRGCGIPEDELAAVFDKFIQSSKTKSGAGGTGLGLSICRQIIDGHGGRIWAENHPEGGALMQFEVPLKQSEQKDENRGEPVNQTEGVAA